MLYPLIFQPIFKERIWGGKRLAELYQKPLPPDSPIGESWEISDHGQDVSVVTNGPLAGKSLRWLMEHHAEELLGTALTSSERFPLLIKILDAQDKLSLQVHPPAALAAQFRGKPKTEMWYIAQATPGAELFVGLKRGITREIFEQEIPTGKLADCFHRIRVQSGDVMFLPSGRVHAIGAGLVIFEIQQNSDTTYRVFDWNRVGLDGQPRELHIRESLASIDFEDIEPGLVRGELAHGPNYTSRLLVNDPLFKVSEITLQTGVFPLPQMSTPQIIGLIDGHLSIVGGTQTVGLRPGQFCLNPACLNQTEAIAEKPVKFLLVNPA